MNIIRLPAVLCRIGISRSKLYVDIKHGNFPAPINLGVRAVGWLDTDIDAWIDAQAALPRRYNASVEVAA